MDGPCTRRRCLSRTISSALERVASVPGCREAQLIREARTMPPRKLFRAGHICRGSGAAHAGAPSGSIEHSPGSARVILFDASRLLSAIGSRRTAKAKADLGEESARGAVAIEIG